MPRSFDCSLQHTTCVVFAQICGISRFAFSSLCFFFSFAKPRCISVDAWLIALAVLVGGPGM